MKNLLAMVAFLLALPLARGEELALLPPPPGRLLAPADGVKIEGPISEQEFFWSVVEDAGRYHLELASDRNFYRVIRSAYTGDNRYIFDRLPFGSYYWRVSSICRLGLEGRSSPVHFFVYNPEIH